MSAGRRQRDEKSNAVASCEDGASNVKSTFNSIKTHSIMSAGMDEDLGPTGVAVVGGGLVGCA